TREETLRRAGAFLGRWPVLVVSDMPAFVTMAEAFHCSFALGADTATRIFLPHYCEAFGGPIGAYTRLKQSGVRFLLFSRLDSFGRLRTRADVPSLFQDLFDEAPEFLHRFSSTAVRTASGIAG
ncbi:MAG: hypothetical protein KDD69_10855, partial [Bdellovibrionales bacterium]|nr:hypothetical protein [Bdellovibrionales bacterium]